MTWVKGLYVDASSISPNPALSLISTQALAKTLIHKTRQIEENRKRGIWYEDHRMDSFGITDERIKKNIDCVAAIMLENDLIDEKNGFSTLKVKNYGKSFNLYEGEAFREQPIIAGWMCSGFLVEKDIIATAGHCLLGRTVKDLRIVFGYKMLDPYTPALKVPNENIYKGVNIIGRYYIPRGSGADWVLLKLDREVEGREMAVLSKDEVVCDQPIYIIGHPMGLPLKYAPGARVRGFKDAVITADLDVYMSSVGSPVFNSDTHEVIGIVVHGDTTDFRWTGNGWASIIYPNRPIYSSGPQFSRVSGIIDVVKVKS
jgi:hypothetical protein